MSSARSDRPPASTGGKAAEVPGTRAWRSLGTTLALWYIAITIGAFATVAVAFALRTHSWVVGDGQRSAEAVLGRYQRALERGGAEAVRQVFATDAQRAEPSLSLSVTDERDVEILEIASDPRSREAATTIRRGSEVAHLDAPADWHVAAATISDGRHLEVVVHDDHARSIWSHAREILWLIFGCGVATSVAGAFLITRRALRPISDLAQATNGILESGDLGLRVAVRGSGDDLEQLSLLFNRMLGRNESLVRAMRESLDNVAHDLRTPLTRLRTGAELALRGPLDGARATEALADVIEETDRVLIMLTTLMDITEAETGAMRLHAAVEDLAALAREATDLYDFVSAERGVHVVTRFEGGVLVEVDRPRMLQVAANLIDNAIKYTPAGGTVEVSVARDRDWGVLSVKDTGRGIPAEDLPRVWDRLFRGDSSRNERGLGLGLALVKAVVEAHGGTVRVRSELDVGSTFEIRVRAT